MSRIFRASAMALAMTLALATVGLSTAQAAEAPIAAHGQLIDDTEAAVSGAPVDIFDVDPEDFPDADPVASETTNTEGVFEADLEPGSYWIAYTGDAFAAEVFAADDISADNDDLGTYVLSAVSVTVTAKLVSPEGTTPGCGFVKAYLTSDGAEADPVYWAEEDSSNYEFGVPPGTYKFQIGDPCDEGVESTWAGGDDTFASGTDFTVAAGKTTALGTLKLYGGSTVAGVVTRTGSPTTKIANVQVTISQDDSVVETDETDAAGAYALTRVKPGTYTIDYSDPIGEFQPASDTITVTRADLTRDQSLVATPPSAGTDLLTGKVTGPTDAALAGITVHVVGLSDQDFVANAQTHRDGTWSVDAPEGVYQVRFTDESDQPVYQSEWFSNARTQSRAKEVEIGDTVVTVNAKLVKLGVVTGRITTPELSDEHTDDLSVRVYDADGDQVKAQAVADDGSYRVTGLVPGTYRLQASGTRDNKDADAVTGLVRQYYKQKYTLASATPLVITDGAQVSAVNIKLSGTLSAYVLPTVRGTAKKGRTLSAAVGSWTRVVDTTYAYQWYRGSSRISGAKSRTYKLTSSDVGRKIKVVVTASNTVDYYLPGVASSALTATVVK